MEQRFLADSNAIIDYVGNKLPESSLLLLDDYFNDTLAVSVITKIEVLGFDGGDEEMKKLTYFFSLANIFYVDAIIAERTIELRRMYKIRTPDAIIAATSLIHGLPLLTRNINDFRKINGVKVINPWEL